MAPNTKKNITLAVIAGICASLLTILALTDKACGYVKERYMIPCVDMRIDDKTKLNNDKLEVLYLYTMEVAKTDGKSQLWDRCVDQVNMRNTIRKFDD